MNDKKPNNKESEVYNTTGFKDTLASPIFYPVIVVTLVLGIFSIFGFLQNPLKLKTVVDVIHQKAAVSNAVSSSIKGNNYSLSNLDETTTNAFYDINPNSNSSEQINTFVIFDGISETYDSEKTIESSIQRVAFNYDISSTQFWTDLDTSKIGAATEESDGKYLETSIIGIPLELEFHQEFNRKLRAQDDSIYTLNKSNNG